MSEWVDPNAYDYEDDNDDFYDEDDFEDPDEAYQEGYSQAYSDAYQDGFAVGNDRLAAELQLDAFVAGQRDAEIEALEAERAQVERTENHIGMQIEEAEEKLGYRLAPETIDHAVVLFLASDDAHILQTIEREITPPDMRDQATRRGRLAAEMEIAQIENEVDREEDDAAVPEELEPHLDAEEHAATSAWMSDARRQRREFERDVRPLTDAEAENFARRTFEARTQGDTNYTFADADHESGSRLDMRRPDDRRLSMAEVLLDERRKAGEDTSQAEADLRWQHGEGHGGDPE